MFSCSYSQLSTSHRSIIIPGTAYPVNGSTYAHIPVATYPSQNCSFRSVSNVFTALSKESLFNKDPTFAKIMAKIMSCKHTCNFVDREPNRIGTTFVPQFVAQLTRLVTTPDVLISEVEQLPKMKMMAEEVAPQKDFQISTDKLIHPIYIGVGDDLLGPAVRKMLRSFSEAGYFGYYVRSIKEAGFLNFWGKMDRTSDQ
ncbi:hypothetical protein Fcan01_25452 [Folsomia candida]|uniref:Uncharacterized protein n=1 Tax=Folsomia candida TaxID=158441 RepID=A0A226D247_FOLCA|nr:hypothetical protein Fcan01_25452 [Folsomia candida]